MCDPFMHSGTAPGRIIRLISSPFVRFARMEAAGGVVLLCCTLLALGWANSPWKHGYEQLLTTQVSIGIGHLQITETRHHWINDGLMSLFFFLVGLEIKREILVGELSSARGAALPIMGALGGMIVPALLYALTARGQGVERGWAIPMSTDIAFVLCLLALLGRRVPLALTVFVTALAIVDDIFAVIVIAIFYTNEINHLSLIMGFTWIGVSFAMNMLGVRKRWVYAVIGILSWVSVLHSGVHATIAGILLAFTIPSDTELNKPEFVEQARSLLDDLETASSNSYKEHVIIHSLEKAVVQAESPLHRIEKRLQPWITFLIVPLFALANAGVNVSAYMGGALRHPVTLGIVLGLAIGKPVGIWLFSVLAVQTRIALPLSEVSWQQMFGCGCLCGIGFTMSLFVAELAFGEGKLLAMAKIATLIASFISAVLGSSALLAGRRKVASEAPEEALVA